MMIRASVDVRGLSCPQPVMKVKQAMLIDGVQLIEVLTDDETSRENIIRFAESRGWSVSLIEGEDQVSTLEITR